MKRRAFTLMEIMVSSGVLLIMVIMTSMATLSYLRAYRHYTSEGLQLRQTAKTLEVLCFHLRSARSMQAPHQERNRLLELSLSIAGARRRERRGAKNGDDRSGSHGLDLDLETRQPPRGIRLFR